MNTDPLAAAVPSTPDVAHPPLATFNGIASDGFVAFVSRLDGSIALTTYQANGRPGNPRRPLAIAGEISHEVLVLSTPPCADTLPS
jgi:hypothetical protein